MALGSHNEPAVTSARADYGCGAVGLGRSMKVDPGSFLILDAVYLSQSYLFRLGQEEDRKGKKRDDLE